ncbi:MAG TPA: leucyl aminopeptidase family protein [Bacillota bacterium]|nr:leucyl aminopeptidase family protein [Bacillota bacterium]
MSRQAEIIFANDERVTRHEQLSHVVKTSKGHFTTSFLDDQFYVIVKDVAEDKQSTEIIRMVAGDISRQLSQLKYDEANISESALFAQFSKIAAEDVVTAFVEGWQLGAYKFLTYKSKETLFATKLQFANEADYATSIEKGQLRANAVSFARDLMNETPDALNPATFPTILQDKFAHTDVDIKVYDEEQLKDMKMNGLLTVCRGSKHSPVFVEMTYRGDESKPLVALVGKGVTFDTGGISLKSGRDLSDMRMDMGGAAAVAGAMSLLAESKAKVNVVALLQIVENIPDNQSVLPGEVIRYRNGHTVQVGNTDAEGRLILADGLIRADELEADYVFNIATLTGAVVNALGPKVAGIFGADDLTEAMKEVGAENGDAVWPLPLVDAYDETLVSHYADFSNISTQSSAGSITAALFLRRFVQSPEKWIHIDKAGRMDESKDDGYYGKSANGFGTRLLADFTEYISNQ